MKFLLAPLFAVAMCFMTSYVTADLKQPYVVLGPSVKDLDVRPGMDASGMRLEGTEFVGQNLSTARFDGCDLFGVHFYQCDLSGASFRGAHLTGMHISDCEIDNADFTDAVINGAHGSTHNVRWPTHDMVLSKEQLLATRSYETRDLDWCLIRGDQDVDYKQFTIRNSRLEGGDFKGCDFTDARIGGSSFFGCTISYDQLASTFNFKRALMIDVGLSVRIRGECDFSNMNLTGSGFSSIKTPDGLPIASLSFDNAIVRGCGFTNPPSVDYIKLNHIRATRSYKEKDLRGVTLGFVDLSGADFSHFDLTDVSFGDCNIESVSFEDAKITGAEFSMCPGLTAEQIQSTWNYQNDRMEGIELPDDILNALGRSTQ